MFQSLSQSQLQSIIDSSQLAKYIKTKKNNHKIIPKEKDTKEKEVPINGYVIALEVIASQHRTHTGIDRIYHKIDRKLNPFTQQSGHHFFDDHHCQLFAIVALQKCDQRLQ